MQDLVGFLIQGGLIFGPVLLFIFVKSQFSSGIARFLLAMMISAGTGWCAFYAAAEHGWKPMLKSGRTIDIAPGPVSWIFGGSILFILLLFAFSKPAGAQTPPAGGDHTREPRHEKRGWRVGHIGRDRMYYEEFRDGTWQRIEIDGEMLMGKAHHVIYFASPEAWKKYPAWAQGRRAEIITRIQSEFTPPDYEYYGANP
jgi:hypothetical protein